VDALTARALPVSGWRSARAEDPALRDVIGAVACVDPRRKRTLDSTARGGHFGLGEFVAHGSPPIDVRSAPPDRLTSSGACVAITSAIFA